MLSFLRDQLWQFVSVIFALLSIFLSLLFYFKQRTRKTLTYSFESTSLISVNDKVRDKIQILYNSKKVGDAHLIILKLWNSGDVPILTNDYEEPITLHFGDKTEILSYDVISTEPSNIKKRVSLKVNTGNLVISPLLLNKGSIIVLKLVLSNFSFEVKAETLISGLNHIQFEDYITSNMRQYKHESFFISQAFFISPALIAFNAIFLLINPRDNIQGTLSFIILGAISSILSGVVLTYGLKQRKSARARINSFM